MKGLSLPRLRVALTEKEKKIIRAINFSLPLIAFLILLVIHPKVFGTAFNFLDPKDSLLLSFVIALSLVPAAALEFKWEWELITLENEIPAFLSALEGNLRAGLPMPKAIQEASKYVKFLRSKLLTMVKAMYLGKTLEEATEYLRGSRSSLLELMADYLAMLSRSGEELFKTVREFREAVETIVSYSKRLRDATRSFLATLYLVMFVYLVSTVIFLATFIYPLSQQTSTMGMPLIGKVNPDVMTSLVIYGMLVEAVTNGVVVSYFTGSRHISSLIHALVLLFVSIAVYAVLVFMKSVLPIPTVSIPKT